MANFNKVIKVLNIKSAVSLQLTPLKRNRDNSLNGILRVDALCVLRWNLLCRLRSR